MWLLMPRYRQSPMRGWTLLLLFARHWMSNWLCVYSQKLSESNGWMVISTSTNLSLVGGRMTRCSHLYIVKIRHKCWAGCVTISPWMFKLEVQLPPFNMWDLRCEDGIWSSLLSQSAICEHSVALWPSLAAPDENCCQISWLEQVPWQLVPDGWLMWVLLPSPWDLPLLF